MKIQLALVASLVVGVGSATAQSPGITASAPGKLSSNLILSPVRESVRDIEKDLGISDDVARSLALLRDEYQAALKKEYADAGLPPIYTPGLTIEQRGAIVRIGKRLSDEYIPQAAELLSPDQITRLRQIEFQHYLIGSGLMMFLSPVRAGELKLTGDQRQAVKLLDSECRQASSGVFSRDALTKLRAEYVDKFIELLTADQKEILSELKGREYLGRW